MGNIQIRVIIRKMRVSARFFGFLLNCRNTRYYFTSTLMENGFGNGHVDLVLNPAGMSSKKTKLFKPVHPYHGPHAPPGAIRTRERHPYQIHFS